MWLYELNFNYPQIIVIGVCWIYRARQFIENLGTLGMMNDLRAKSPGIGK